MARLQCLSCDQYQLSKKKCKAYPRGIPAAIFNGEVDHKFPYQGDRGIRYLDLKIDGEAENAIDNVSKVMRIVVCLNITA